ncbi:hypothetical protein [Asticcacaulis sp. AC460]|uniref:hypothetical protein n=1 Tax=Asticcacaulis sp. AC460 TaxID=1282360 RepID=UPI0012DE1777|nr:hypothetical protein [Asticcacaulis sp. AC460]
MAGLAATLETAMASSYAPESWPCDPSMDLRTSDLCAQWKAADAARDSANWTAIAFIVGTVINFAALIAVALTFREARRSANAAMLAANSAGELLKADRAWVLADGPTIEYDPLRFNPDGDDYQDLLIFALTVTNFGSTPALGVAVNATLWVKYEPTGIAPKKFDGRTRRLSALAPNQSEVLYFWFFGESGREFMRTSSGEIDMEVTYFDVFERNQPRIFHSNYTLSVEQTGPSSYYIGRNNFGQARVT